jgi:hypothetical protein
MRETREQIKTRMLKNAARIWGYPETEAENSFDPLVSLLLGACATELEKISDEIHASRGRVLERLVHLLSPEVLTGALPAHAIASAVSAENNAAIEHGTQLYAKWKIVSAGEEQEAVWKDIYFSPTGVFNINRSSVRFMATGNRLYKMKDSINKEILAYSEHTELAPSTLWIATDEPEVSLHDSLFYFDFRNQAEQHFFLHHLPKAKWSINDFSLKHLPGYGSREVSGENIDIDSILHHDHDVSSKIKKHINAYYKKSFINLLDEKNITTKKELIGTPAEITNVFEGKETEQLLQQPLRWIKIQFPETVSNNLLQDAVCVMNCFPVLNSRLHEINYRLQDIINIIPFGTEDLFLDIEEVLDEEANPLHIRPIQDGNTASVTMLMRNGGIGRFDERDAAGIIDYLLQLLRDETAAFSSLGSDFVSSEIKQMHQVMNKLQQRLFSKQIHSEQTPYLFIRNNKKQQWKNLFIKYRSTCGQEGNNIKSGTGLQVYKGGAINGNLAKLVTTTIGGRNKLNTTESVMAYKSALLSKDRLNSAEDIKAFCQYHLGNRLQKFEIKRGTVIPDDERNGYIKTTDVILYLHSKALTELKEKDELVFWQNNLKLLIEERSAALIQYRVFIR